MPEPDSSDVNPKEKNSSSERLEEKIIAGIEKITKTTMGWVKRNDSYETIVPIKLKIPDNVSLLEAHTRIEEYIDRLKDVFGEGNISIKLDISFEPISETPVVITNLEEVENSIKELTQGSSSDNSSDLSVLLYPTIKITEQNQEAVIQAGKEKEI